LRVPRAVSSCALFSSSDHEIFRIAIETSQAGTVVCDDRMTIVFSNRRAEALFGYTPGSLVGCSVSLLIPGMTGDGVSHGPVHFGGRGENEGVNSALWEARRHDGSMLWLELQRTSIVRNGRRFVIVSMIEMPERTPPTPGENEEAMAVASEIPDDVSGIRAPASIARVRQPRVTLGDDKGAIPRPVSRYGQGQVIAESAAVRSLMAQVVRVATTSATVLLTGETGSGKEVFAQAIHDQSVRQRRPMVRVNCAAIPEGLLESELFGRERGAYTGALNQQIGRFEQADKSTIFLDEIGELPLEGQVKLLRVLQSKEVERLGGNRSVKVDVRIIAATNRDLARAIDERQFREDLYYRLNIFPLYVPPLRVRTADIPPLVWAFVDEIAAACDRRIESISRASMDALTRYAWPGNVRELRNLVERSVIVSTGTHLRIDCPQGAAVSRVNSLRLDDIEVEHIRAVLDRTGWRIRGAAGAADLLGMKPTTLESRMAKHGIRRSA
jgi:PAS domain S-box-containing protein